MRKIAFLKVFQLPAVKVFPVVKLSGVISVESKFVLLISTALLYLKRRGIALVLRFERGNLISYAITLR
jgi:hypothetical protein